MPEHLSAEIYKGTWPIQPLWPFIQKKGHISDDEMYRVFNMGIGMIAVVDETRVDELRSVIPETVWEIGTLVSGKRKIILS